MDYKVLIVEDEPKLRQILQDYFESRGDHPVTAPNGIAALEIAEKEEFDGVLLDIMMPEVDGYEACRKIREKYNTPIIMLTARAEELDKVLGLELGADDYVTKPFGVRELMARIKANLRKAELSKGEENDYYEEIVDGENKIIIGDLYIDTEKLEVKVKDRQIDLTLREFEVLKYLAMYSPLFSKYSFITIGFSLRNSKMPSKPSFIRNITVNQVVLNE